MTLDLIASDNNSLDLTLVVDVISQKLVNLDFLRRVHCRKWTKAGALDVKVIDRSTFVFYFKDLAEIKLVLKKAPRTLIITYSQSRGSFQVCLLVWQLIQLHDLPLHWRIESIARRIVEKIDSIIEINKFYRVVVT